MSMKSINIYNTQAEYEADYDNRPIVSLNLVKETGKVVVDEELYAVIFTAEEADSTIGLQSLSIHQTLEYSTDAKYWDDFNTNTIISLRNIGDKVYVRGVLCADNDAVNFTNFSMTGKIAASGNCNALLDCYYKNASLKKYCYYRLFYRCDALISAPDLPAITLEDYCYLHMFNGCMSLTTTPELPATTLAKGCYSNMFNNCTSLVTAPTLPAMELAELCYSMMFYECNRLITAPELPATELKTECYNQMFYGCTSLTTAPEILPATTIINSCYRYMFYGCASLITAPVLPAPVLAEDCYYSMFEGCKNLNRITCLAIDMSAEDCTYAWLYATNSSGVFVKATGATWETSTNGIPAGWTIQDYAG